MVPPHSHACQRCGAPTLCHGDLERNHDGCPAVTCRDFHLSNGEVNQDHICGRCQWTQDHESAEEAA